MTTIVIDNCTLVNFAAVGQLKLLRDCLRGRGRWTQAIEFECRKSVRYYSALNGVLTEGWLGEPLEFDSDSEVRGVQNIWRALSQPLSKPTDNLGEAEAIYGILNRAVLKDAIFLTDDNPAADFCAVPAHYGVANDEPASRGIRIRRTQLPRRLPHA